MLHLLGQENIAPLVANMLADTMPHGVQVDQQNVGQKLCGKHCKHVILIILLDDNFFVFSEILPIHSIKQQWFSPIIWSLDLIRRILKERNEKKVGEGGSYSNAKVLVVVVVVEQG